MFQINPDGLGYPPHSSETEDQGVIIEEIEEMAMEDQEPQYREGRSNWRVPVA